MRKITRKADIYTRSILEVDVLISEDGEILLYQAFLDSTDPRLFAPRDESAASIEATHNRSWRECRIWQGYFAESLLLLREISQQGRPSNLIFPALFNLRHAIEVALKWHIQYAGGVVPTRAGHNLDALIDAFRLTVDDLEYEASYISDHALDRIAELASIDPRSVVFRYGTEHDGSTISIAPECWDVFRIYFTVDNLLIWFDNLSDQIALCRDEEYQARLRENQ